LDDIKNLAKIKFLIISDFDLLTKMSIRKNTNLEKSILLQKNEKMAPIISAVKIKY
jgi:hypothetical protein